MSWSLRQNLIETKYLILIINLVPSTAKLLEIYADRHLDMVVQKQRKCSSVYFMPTSLPFRVCYDLWLDQQPSCSLCETVRNFLPFVYTWTWQPYMPLRHSISQWSASLPEISLCIVFTDLRTTCTGSLAKWMALLAISLATLFPRILL